MDTVTTCLKVADLVRELGLGKASIYKLLQSGELRSVRVGPKRDRYRVTTEDVKDYLEKGRTP